jgi:hypothetical protein
MRHVARHLYLTCWLTLYTTVTIAYAVREMVA